jgi:NhaA family Na+:H+ antiporter
MAVFFLLVGLEINREVLDGEISSVSRAALPVLAAAGGMAVPAAFYLAANWGNPATTGGWAIPAATDIAFALGVLALLGKRAPASLKIFLLAIAIIDDLGAIVIIALFYTANLSLLALGLAVVGVAGLVVLNRSGVTRIAPYVLVGVFLWVCVLKSGVHATLAGVALAFAIPLKDGRANGRGPLHDLEHALHPWVAFGILPVFAFANAGVPLAGLSWNAVLEPVTLGIILGLFFGKQIGVFVTTWIAVRAGVGRLPDGAGWIHVYGVAVLTGIGFTMSLFIGELAFPAGDQSAALRVGVLGGSLLSALIGYLVLLAASRRT